MKTGFRETVIRGNDSGASDGKVFLGTGTTTAVEGGEVVFTLTREDGPVSQDLTVRVETWEPNRIVGFGNNPSSQNHWLTFEPWEDSISFSVYPYVDRVAEAGADQLKAEIKNVGGARYTVGNPYTATVNIDDPPTDAVPVTLSASTNSINEGGSATFTLTRTGTTTADLVVDVRVDDPSDFLRGNHWDPAPAIPSEVVIPASSSTAAFTLTAPDDQRDITDDSLTVTVVPGTGYYPGQIGLSTSASVSVTDNDEAQELTFRWGHVKALDDWGAGNSWFTRDGPGPAEGLFYYDDDRPFLFDTTKVDEWFPIHFEVKRRDTDVGKTATFVVRVEHDRRWNSPRHTDWSTDPETGNRYKDYFLTLEGNQRKVLGRIEILDNGLPDPPGWSYRASIRQIEDANGVPVTAAQEARYWTVNGLRSGDEGPIDHGFPKVNREHGAPGQRGRGPGGGVHSHTATGQRAGAPARSGPHLGTQPPGRRRN